VTKLKKINLEKKEKIINELKQKNNNYFEVECENCNHGYHCILLIKPTSQNDVFEYHSIQNENEEEKQYYWHNDSLYYSSKKKCEISVYEGLVKDQEKEISELEQKIMNKKKILEEVREKLITLKESP
jgi:hypothetical protein